MSQDGEQDPFALFGSPSLSHSMLSHGCVFLSGLPSLVCVGGGWGGCVLEGVVGPVCVRKGVKGASLLSPTVPSSTGLKFLPARPQALWRAATTILPRNTPDPTVPPMWDWGCQRDCVWGVLTVCLLAYMFTYVWPPAVGALSPCPGGPDRTTGPVRDGAGSARVSGGLCARPCPRERNSAPGAAFRSRFFLSPAP